MGPEDVEHSSTRGRIIPTAGEGMLGEGEKDKLNEGFNRVDVGKVYKQCDVLLGKARSCQSKHIVDPMSLTVIAFEGNYLFSLHGLYKLVDRWSFTLCRLMPA